MRSIAKLFGKSPFVPLQSHMDKVEQCVDKAVEVLEAFLRGDHQTVAVMAEEVSSLEHEADQIKHDIKNHLPRSLFLAVDREQLLEILSTQDSLADKAENLAVLLTLKTTTVSEALKDDLKAFIDKNVEAFRAVRRIITELNRLLETGFGGDEAEKVVVMVEQVARLEYESDILQRKILKTLFACENEFSVGEFFFWSQLIRQLSELSNLAERLANRVRVTLELKK